MPSKGDKVLWLRDLWPLTSYNTWREPNMLYQRLHRTGAILRRICAMLAILSVSVAGVAAARSFEGAVSHSDGVRVSVDHVEIDDHTVTLGLQAENQSSQMINLNNLNVGNGLS